MSVQESPAEVWVSGGLLWWPASGSEAQSVAVHTWDLFKEVTIIFITSTIIWPQVKPQGGNTAPPNRKLDLRFTEHAPAQQNKT